MPRTNQERRISPGWCDQRRLGVALVAIALALMAALDPVGASKARPVAAVRQGEATPAATPVAPAPATPAETPARDANAACSIVLGIGDTSSACVAWVNAVPDSDPVSFSADQGGSLAEGLAYGDFADFTAVPSTDVLSVQATLDGESDDIVAEASVPLDASVAYVIVLEQRYDGEGSALVAVPLDLGALGNGTARLAFHHAVTDAAGLSVSGLDPPSDAAIAPGETTRPIDVAAGQYAATVTPANDAETTLATLDLELEPDLSYLVIVAGTTGDDSVTVIYAAAPVATPA